MSRRPDTPCATCGTLMWGGRGSLPAGQRRCLKCRRADDDYGIIKRPAYVPRPRKQPTQHYCQACNTPLPLRTERLYCSVACQPKREPQAPRTDLQWKQCGHCQRWVCKPGRKYYCSDYCARERAATRNGSRNRSCKRCGIGLGTRSLLIYCEPCRQQNTRDTRKRERRHPDYRSLRNHRQRARHYGVEYEPVKRSKVLERDGWTCGICRKPINPKLTYPNIKSASLDHIVPMSLGGGHTYINTQAAHFICNSIKSHHGTGDQLALIG